MHALESENRSKTIAIPCQPKSKIILYIATSTIGAPAFTHTYSCGMRQCWYFPLALGTCLRSGENYRTWTLRSFRVTNPHQNYAILYSIYRNVWTKFVFSCNICIQKPCALFILMKMIMMIMIMIMIINTTLARLAVKIQETCKITNSEKPSIHIVHYRTIKQTKPTLPSNLWTQIWPSVIVYEFNRSWIFTWKTKNIKYWLIFCNNQLIIQWQ